MKKNHAAAHFLFSNGRAYFVIDEVDIRLSNGASGEFAEVEPRALNASHQWSCALECGA